MAGRHFYNNFCDHNTAFIFSFAGVILVGFVLVFDMHSGFVAQPSLELLGSSPSFSLRLSSAQGSGLVPLHLLGFFFFFFFNK